MESTPESTGPRLWALGSSEPREIGLQVQHLGNGVLFRCLSGKDTARWLAENDVDGGGAGHRHDKYLWQQLNGLNARNSAVVAEVIDGNYCVAAPNCIAVHHQQACPLRDEPAPRLWPPSSLEPNEVGLRVQHLGNGVIFRRGEDRWFAEMYAGSGGDGKNYTWHSLNSENADNGAEVAEILGDALGCIATKQCAAVHHRYTCPHAEPPMAIVHEDTEAEKALRDLLVAVNRLDPVLICSRYKAYGGQVVLDILEAAERALRHYPGEGRLVEIPVVVDTQMFPQGYQLAHNFALGPLPTRRTISKGGIHVPLALKVGENGPYYVVEESGAPR